MTLQGERETTPPKSTSLPTSLQKHTPHRLKVSGSSHHSSTIAHLNAQALYESVRQDSVGHYEVGIDPSNFLETFMPWGDKTPDGYRSATLSDAAHQKLQSVPPSSGESEKHMYPKYVEAFTDWPPPVTTSAPRTLAFISLPDKVDHNCDSLKIDLATYSIEDKSHIQATDFALMQTQEEFKQLSLHDPFVDPEEGKTSFEGVEHDSEPARETRGQITTYAALTLFMSFRTHLFTVVIFNKFARLIRWDRSSATVTRRFDYTQHPEILGEFYLRYGQLSSAERGFDPHVERLDPDSQDVKEAMELFRHYDKDYWYANSGPRYMEVPVPRFWYKVHVEEVSSNGMRSEADFIVPNPLYDRHCCDVFSRATRRSLAYDVQSKKLCFMKDYWYEPSSRSEPESVIYDILKAAKVRNIAEKVIGGDVAGCETKRARLLRKTMRMHRLVLATIARELATFCWAKVMVTCVADVVEAVQDALSKARVMHRDLSASNIMIYTDPTTKQWRGIVIDWDLCILIDKLDNNPRLGKTGTHQFMSAYLLTGGENHSILDDKESALWVLVYMGLHYLPFHQNLPQYAEAAYGSPQRLYKYVTELFDDPNAGVKKMDTLILWANKTNVPRFVVSEFTQLLSDLATEFASRYLENVAESPHLISEIWLVETLRLAAAKMPPDNVSVRSNDPATPKFDFFPNEMVGPLPGRRRTVLSGLHPSRVHGLDGRKRSNQG